jgi:hypothetical protein
VIVDMATLFADEELRLQALEESRRQKLLERRKDQVKAELILKALAEENDLDALRAEKRAILQEEARIKALLELEKAKLHRKADMYAAIRAERQRHRAKKEYRRDKYVSLQKRRAQEERRIKMASQGLVEDPKTGYAVSVETEEGWFVLQELRRAGNLPPEYARYLPELEAEDARLVEDGMHPSEVRPQDGWVEESSDLRPMGGASALDDVAESGLEHVAGEAGAPSDDDYDDGFEEPEYEGDGAAVDSDLPHPRDIESALNRLREADE